MTPADVRLTAQLVVDKRVHCVTDEAVEAMARRVLELEVALDAVRAVGVTVERREDGTGWAVTNTRAVEAEAVEREACAKLCDAEQARWHDTEATDVLDGDRWQHRQQANTARDLAVLIRARGAK